MRWQQHNDGRYKVWTRGNYEIRRWAAYDRGTRVMQYQATVAGEALHAEPLRSLEAAKRTCSDHRHRMQIRRHIQRRADREG